MCHGGGYKRAMARINDVLPADSRSLKASQYLAYFSGVLKLQRQIHRQVLTDKKDDLRSSFMTNSRALFQG